MRVVDLETFKTLPNGTIYFKYEPCVMESMQIKAGSNEWDFWGQGFDMVESNDSMEWSQRLFDMADNGASYPLDLDATSRDGLFEKNQLFLVYEPEDMARFIAFLTEAHQTGEYPTSFGRS